MQMWQQLGLAVFKTVSSLHPKTPSPARRSSPNVQMCQPKLYLCFCQLVPEQVLRMPNDGTMTCGFESVSEPNLLSLMSLNSMDWQTLTSWQSTLDVAGLPSDILAECPSAQPALDRLLAAGALPFSDEVLVCNCESAEEDTLKTLQSHELVKCVAGPGGSSHWQVTTKGVQVLQTRLLLSKQTPALVVRDVPLQELFIWELLSLCSSQGWLLQIRGAGRGAGPKPAPYRSGGRKDLWVRLGDQSVSRSYLLALSLAVAPPPLAEPRVVPHFAKNRVYDDLVDSWLGTGVVSRRHPSKKCQSMSFQFQSSNAILMEEPAGSRVRHSRGPQKRPKRHLEHAAPPEPEAANVYPSASASTDGAEKEEPPHPVSELNEARDTEDVPGSATPEIPRADVPEPVPPSPPMSVAEASQEVHRRPARPSNQEVRRARQVGSFGWGQFWFGHRPAAAGRAGSYEVTCKLHSDAGKRCNKSRVFHSEQDWIVSDGNKRVKLVFFAHLLPS